MIAQRSSWKKKFRSAQKEIHNLPFIKSELEKCTFKCEILTQKHRDICIAIHTQTFIQENTLSQVIGIDINNANDFHDCTLISKQRIDHAILTGLSNVYIDKKTGKVVFLSLYFDEYDMPPPIDSSKFRSKGIKLRNIILDHLEHNDSWIPHMKQKINDHNYNYNMNSNTKARDQEGGYGKVLYAAYGARNLNVVNQFSKMDLSYRFLNLFREVDGLVIYKVGYHFWYGIQAHKSTVLFAKAMHNVVNDINNYKNVNYNCRGYLTKTSEWNFSKFRPFVEYTKKCNLKVDDRLSVLSCLIYNVNVIRNNKWNLEQYWKWSINELGVRFAKEFIRLKQENNNDKEDVDQEKIISAKL